MPMAIRRMRKRSRARPGRDAGRRTKDEGKKARWTPLLAGSGATSDATEGAEAGDAPKPESEAVLETSAGGLAGDAPRPGSGADVGLSSDMENDRAGQKHQRSVDPKIGLLIVESALIQVGAAGHKEDQEVLVSAAGRLDERQLASGEVGAHSRDAVFLARVEQHQ